MVGQSLQRHPRGHISGARQLHQAPHTVVLMAPNSASFGFGGTPAFFARMMAIPAINDALTLATQVYDNTKRNEVMGAAIKAAETSMRVAATSALPLAAPILDRVGGWEAVDEWACRGLDRVEEAAPIIKKPTKEIVNRTRETVLGAVAGDKLIVPDTITEALVIRANRMMEVVTENVGVKAATNVAENALDTAHVLVNTYLPPGGGDKAHPDVSGAGVRERTLILARKTGHRLYRTALRMMRPDLAYRNDAVITPGMMMEFARGTVMNLYTELLRVPRPGEQVGVLMTFARTPVRFVVISTSTFNTSVLTTLIPILQETTKTLQEVLKEPSSRLGPMIQESYQIIRVAAENTTARFTPFFIDTVRRALDATSMREVREVVIDYGKYVGEEARLWGKVLVVLIQLTPNFALRVSETTRILTADVLRRAMTSLESRGRPAPLLLKKGFVPVKVTMMAPRDTF
ncbi:uncharacterized protein LOC121860097 [Homarus americanus]|uniref:Perilipin-2-like 3 n=1 Tax=Homarus americanus TaxID=6706 RepID=A0A8J5TL09_HOMAM|nr:uncharacterized protein LOC121860097 [Homarus americanus]KAG7177809.1 Perilipin-2-like 3 [Homarus americanus]